MFNPGFYWFDKEPNRIHFLPHYNRQLSTHPETCLTSNTKSLKIMSLSEIMKLSIPERILLVEAIWDSIVNDENKSSYELSDEQIQFLEEEIKAYSKNPEQGSTWEEVKNRIKIKIHHS